MKNKLITGVVAGFVFLAFAGGASAVMTAEDLEAKKLERDVKQDEIQAEKDLRQDEIQTKREEVKTQRCEQIKEKTRARITKFGENNKYHQKNFNLIKENVDDLVALFKAEGINTTKLESYLVILQTKLTKLYADHDAFVVALEASVGLDCTNIETTIKGKFQIAKQEGADIKSDIIDIKNYYKETIRPELLNLKQEYLKKTEADSSTDDDEVTEKPTE